LVAPDDPPSDVGELRVVAAVVVGVLLAVVEVVSVPDVVEKLSAKDVVVGRLVVDVAAPPPFNVGVTTTEELKLELPPSPPDVQDPALSEQSQTPPVSVPHQTTPDPQFEHALEHVFPEPQIPPPSPPLPPPPLPPPVHDPVASEQSHAPLVSVPHQMYPVPQLVQADVQVEPEPQRSGRIMLALVKTYAHGVDLPPPPPPLPPLPPPVQDPVLSEQSQEPPVSVPHQIMPEPQLEQAAEQVLPLPQSCLLFKLSSKPP
jgi:hypothetical protein